MIASVYIKDGNIHFYNEQNSFSNIGGIAYELGRPLLDFICYEPERFDDGFSMIAEAFDNEFAHVGAREPEFIAELIEMMTELQQEEIYVFFYAKELMDAIYSSKSLQNVVKQLSNQLCALQEFIINEIEVLLHYRKETKVLADRPIDF